MSAQSTDYDALMQANLAQVFSQRDATHRMAAIEELYATDAVLYEPDTAVSGHAAISQAVETLLSHLPPNTFFTAIGPAVGHHGLARLRWQAASSGGLVIVTSTDVARFEGARIKTLHVLIDPRGA
ncbi:hypothetical protein APY04_0026 [Hyphomicrobium sulfonivorans]|uniref:SnoaL-like domain-containing protein n=1 Tax=Hyphomicrobium sulfonivorans TaxID=121290 RepID=A0A109BQL4_HYPSL|nr:nuclear transport factor 2 family protein [Hyphomicrobium sulfonivorans]KWT72976.1 hypothetical protein APY04_0026 [Hyphomicrobium sulfonivorans]